MSEVTIRGWVTLAAPEHFDDAVAIVGLDDVTHVDAESTRIAEVVIEPLRGVHARIPFSLSVDANALRASSSFTLTAEIRTTRKEALSRGDFLSTAAHPWSAASDREATIPVQRI
jgi:uncharacterized lipoprotein YbaY